jgi:hypothetical protein
MGGARMNFAKTLNLLTPALQQGMSPETRKVLQKEMT